jgi:hypothetical protein
MAKGNGDGTQDGSANRYGEELLSANWNPAIDLLDVSAPSSTARGGSETLREEDVDGFLGRIYTLGC